MGSVPTKNRERTKKFKTDKLSILKKLISNLRKSEKEKRRDADS